LPSRALASTGWNSAGRFEAVGRRVDHVGQRNARALAKLGNWAITGNWLRDSPMTCIRPTFGARWCRKAEQRRGGRPHRRAGAACNIRVWLVLFDAHWM
jgi:hypothetical protein